jgi:hypothetical protein
MKLDKNLNFDDLIAELNHIFHCFQNWDGFEIRPNPKNGGTLVKYYWDDKNGYTEDLSWDYDSREDLIDKLIKYYN